MTVERYPQVGDISSFRVGNPWSPMYNPVGLRFAKIYAKCFWIISNNERRPGIVQPRAPLPRR